LEKTPAKKTATWCMQGTEKRRVVGLGCLLVHARVEQEISGTLAIQTKLAANNTC
jgi:hypothetical protein